jgi:pimeloyl-ACP methyl ester carboxylesterase
VSAITHREVVTRRGIDATVHVRGAAGSPVVWFHGAGGLLPTEPVLDALAADHVVYAPEWPGYGVQETETRLFDMLDFALHGLDLLDALQLDESPHVIGHSMGGMIAAEMAALNPSSIASLTLIGAAGLWLDEHPVPDLFSMVPFELAEVLFVDPVAGEQMLTAGRDFTDDAALIDFMVGNARRMGTAGKILFPIPNRGLADRLYRITCPTTLVWGELDRMFPLVYAERFRELLTSTDARLVTVPGAGHMAPYERPNAVVSAVRTLARA